MELKLSNELKNQLIEIKKTIKKDNQEYDIMMYRDFF
jgi:hypothetical protein